jgi:mannose-6-phosphate isomerase-like protein (cupin superfamily)
MDMLYRIPQSPPPPRPPGLGNYIENNLPPGWLRWMVIEFADPSTYEGSNHSADLHHTNTNSFLYVQEGAVRFGLQDGVHELRAGDCVMITGVDHSYVAGPGGCRLLVTQVGVPAPD